MYSEVALLLLRHEVQCGAGIMQIGALVKIQHSEVLTRGLTITMFVSASRISVDTPDCAWQQAELSLYVELALDCVAYHITLLTASAWQWFQY